MPAGSTRCDLCGTDLTHEPRTDEQPEAPPPIGPEAKEDAMPSRQFCTECGSENPGHARFCWQCGARLAAQDAPAGRSSPRSVPATAAEPVAPAEDDRRVDAAGKQAFTLLGIAVGVVILLFVATQLLSGSSDTAPDAPSEAPASASTPIAPLPPETTAAVERLEARIAEADDPALRLRAQQDLVETLVSAGAFARAGAVQATIAQQTDAAAAWADAGSFYLAHMLRTQDPQERSTYAQRSARAYEAALEREPDDLDVKTDLATAYLNDPQNPMEAVTVILEVLDADPDHARARFNYGLMLSQIGRFDQAREQFERVVASTSDDELVHERARAELAQLDQIEG